MLIINAHRNSIEALGLRQLLGIEITLVARIGTVTVGRV
jgi:hypothetical protein